MREWGWLDSLLIYAYQRFVDTTCSECGGYVFECRDPDNQHKYVVDTNGACYRKEALDDVTRAKDYKPKNGQVLRVAPIDDDLISWPTFNRP